jgi:hypothetical protein
MEVAETSGCLVSPSVGALDGDGAFSTGLALRARLPGLLAALLLAGLCRTGFPRLHYFGERVVPSWESPALPLRKGEHARLQRTS